MQRVLIKQRRESAEGDRRYGVPVAVNSQSMSRWTMHRSDVSPVATTATEPRRHPRHSSACTSWPGKSWRRPKCLLYARGVSVMRAAALYPTATLRILVTTTTVSPSTIPSFTLLWGLLSLLLRLPPLPPLGSVSVPLSTSFCFSTAASSLSPHHMKSSWRIYDVINYCLLGGEKREKRASANVK